MKISYRNHQVQNRTSQQRGTARIVPVFAILFVIALGALAAPRASQQDRDHDRDRDFDRFIFVAHERMAIDFGGGHGGRPSSDALCEEGSVAVGFHVQTGEFFNTAWLDCARIDRDGHLSGDRQMTGRTGSPGGRPVHDAYCPEHFALRGLRGRTGGSIDEAVGECSPLHEIAARVDNARTEWTQPVMRPNAGGHPAQAECPRGSVVTGFRSTSGEYMDHLWIVCSELRARDHDHDHDRDH